MEHDPLQNDIRKARRRRRLGPTAICALCGETASETLENHHIVGTANDPALKLRVCRNCHAKLTEAQRAAGVDLRHTMPRTLPEVIASVLRALGAFFQALGKKLSEWADRLLAFVRALDVHCPQWRDLPEAQA